MNPGDVVPLSFNGGLVALSFLTAVLGSYVALLAAVGIRTETQDGDIRLGYILIGAVAMGGVGIWSMHFIGMQAQDLPFLVGYQVGLTVLSFLVAAGFSGWAFWYVGRDRFTIGRCLVGGLAAGPRRRHALCRHQRHAHAGSIPVESAARCFIGFDSRNRRVGRIMAGFQYAK